MRRSLQQDRLSERAKDYSYLNTRVERRVEEGRKKVELKRESFETFFAYGEQFQKLVGRNGKPLSPDEQKREDDKMRRALEKREKKVSSDPTSISDYARNTQQQRKMLVEIPKAFDFKRLNDAVEEGRPVYVIEATPKPGYQPPNREAKMFTKVRGVLHIDKGTYQWVKADVEFIDNVAFGLFLVNVQKGSRVFIQQKWVNNEVWLPEHVIVNFAAKLGGIKTLRREIENVYTEFKKYNVDVKQTVGEKALR